MVQLDQFEGGKMIDNDIQLEVAPPEVQDGPPHSRESEEAVLGSILINPDIYNDLAQFLRADDFYIHRFRWIWESFTRLKEAGTPVDTLTVSEDLDRQGRLSEVGGAAYLTALFNQVPTTLNAVHYGRIVKTASARRKMLTAANSFATDAYNEGESVPAILAKLARQLEPINYEVQEMEEGGDGKYSTWADINSGPIEYSWKGWLVNGLLTLLVSYSGDGKSLLALRICGCFINGQPFPDGTPYTGEAGKVLWVECEAAQALNLDRAKNFKYPLGSIITPFTDPLADICLDDPNHRAIIERRAALPEVKLIIIDSLSGGSNRKENETGIKDICLWAAKLARDLNKPLLLIHHLGKRKEWDTEAITLDRVRGSSAIVQFARIVWALSCPDATNKETKRLEQIKNNTGRFPEAIGMTAGENGISFGIAPKVPHIESAGERTADFLISLLTAGPVKAVDVEAELNGAGLSYVTAKREKDRLGIISVKKVDGWWWSLAARQSE